MPRTGEEEEAVSAIGTNREVKQEAVSVTSPNREVDQEAGQEEGLSGLPRTGKEGEEEETPLMRSLRRLGEAMKAREEQEEREEEAARLAAAGQEAVKAQSLNGEERKKAVGQELIIQEEEGQEDIFYDIDGGDEDFPEEAIDRVIFPTRWRPA